jgi:hypothetical protein
MLHQVLLMLARSSLITHALCTTRLQVCYEAREIEMTARTGTLSLPANLKSQTAQAQDIIPSSFPPPFPRYKDRSRVNLDIENQPDKSIFPIFLTSIGSILRLLRPDSWPELSRTFDRLLLGGFPPCQPLARSAQPPS